MKQRVCAVLNAVSLPPTQTVPESVPAHTGNRRWLICGLLFFAATVNYMDRQVIALLKPMLQVQFGWTEVGYSNIVTAFQFAYGAGLLFIGKLIDRLGTRKGFSLAVFVWSAAAMAHAAASSVFQFGMARFSLGIGESGSFPASIKAVSEWFPKRERALTTGLFNSGSNIGALVTPLVVPWLTHRYGWRMAFIATGALGFVWIACWLAFYHRPQDDTKLSAAELAYIQSDPPDQNASKTAVPWRIMLQASPGMGYRAGKILYRSHLVGLPVLDAGLPQPQSRNEPERNAAATVCHLQRSLRRQHRRRLAFVFTAEARMGAEPQPEVRALGMRIGRDSNHACRPHQ